MDAVVSQLVEREVATCVFPSKCDMDTGAAITSPVVKRLLEAGGYEAARGFVDGMLERYPIPNLEGPDPLEGFTDEEAEENPVIASCIFHTLLEALVASGLIMEAHAFVDQYAEALDERTAWGYIHLAWLSKRTEDIAHAFQHIELMDDGSDKAHALGHFATIFRHAQARERLKILAEGLVEAEDWLSASSAYIELIHLDPRTVDWTKALRVLTAMDDRARLIFGASYASKLINRMGMKPAQAFVLRLPAGTAKQAIQRELRIRERKM